MYDIAWEQMGAMTRRQLIEAGVTPRQIKAALVAGRLRRVGRSAVAPAVTTAAEGAGRGAQLDEMRQVWAACEAQVRARAVFFRCSAAVLWELDGAPDGPVELAVPSGHPRGAALRRARPVPPGERTTLEGLPVTTAARTLLDLGQVANASDVERALESALRRQLVTLTELHRVLALSPTRPGTGHLRRLVAGRPAGTPPTGSDAETLFLQLARRSRLPAPERQFGVTTPEGRYRVDFAWPERRLAVEVDGAATHASREALAADLRRQNALVLQLSPAGWALLRFAWEDVALDRYAGQTTGRLQRAWAAGLPPFHGPREQRRSG